MGDRSVGIASPKAGGSGANAAAIPSPTYSNGNAISPILTSPASLAAPIVSAEQLAQAITSQTAALHEAQRAAAAAASTSISSGVASTSDPKDISVSSSRVSTGSAVVPSQTVGNSKDRSLNDSKDNSIDSSKDRSVTSSTSKRHSVVTKVSALSPPQLSSTVAATDHDDERDMSLQDDNKEEDRLPSKETKLRALIQQRFPAFSETFKDNDESILCELLDNFSDDMFSEGQDQLTLNDIEDRISKKEKSAHQVDQLQLPMLRRLADCLRPLVGSAPVIATSRSNEPTHTVVPVIARSGSDETTPTVSVIARSASDGAIQNPPASSISTQQQPSAPVLLSSGNRLELRRQLIVRRDALNVEKSTWTYSLLSLFFGKSGTENKIRELDQAISHLNATHQLNDNNALRSYVKGTLLTNQSLTQKRFSFFCSCSYSTTTKLLHNFEDTLLQKSRLVT